VSECTFVLLAGPRDSGFLKATLQHLLRMCSFPFREILVVADDLPRGNRSLNTEIEVSCFADLLLRLTREQTVTRCVYLSEIATDRLAEKHFGSRVSTMRDHRSIPLFAWIAGIEAAQTDFVVHFDSDILLHQTPGHSWINAGMSLLQEDPLTMFVAPLPGPPSGDGSLRAQTAAPTLDNQGNFRFKTFSSRRFLLSKQRFEKLLPTPLRYTSIKRRLLMPLGFRNAILPWEYCVSCALQKSKYYRVHLCSPKAWSLHCQDHSHAWLRSLPVVIRRVEEGQYPAEQGGHYDLMLPAWT
jgi:hypothetical protein